MKPLTDSVPKCLLPVRGVPMLEIWLDLCRRHGIEEILINIHAHADAVRDFLERSSTGLRVCVSEEKTLLGSAGTLLHNRKRFAAGPFWIFYSDVLTTADLGAMLNLHRARRTIATLGVYDVPDPTRCGIVTVNDRDIVVDFVEKPQHPTGRLAFAGIMVANPTLFNHLPEKIPADIGFDLLPRLVGKMSAYHVRDYLLDVGTPENYHAAQVSWPGFRTRQTKTERSGYGP